MQNPPHPPDTMLSGAAGRLLRYKTNRTPSDLVRVVNIVRGERGDEGLQLSRMQGFDFIVHLLSLLAFKHTLHRALHDSDICGHWLSAGWPLVCHWLAAGHWPTSGPLLVAPLAAHWPAIDHHLAIHWPPVGRPLAGQWYRPIAWRMHVKNAKTCSPWGCIPGGCSTQGL